MHSSCKQTLDMDVLFWLFEGIMVKKFNNFIFDFLSVWSWYHQLLSITINLLC